MAIVEGDLKFYYTQGVGGSSDGGATGTAAGSLGGYRSSTEVIETADVTNIFEDVSGADALAGETFYKCVCVRNTHGSLDLTDALFSFTETTLDTGVTMRYALENSTGAAQTIANSETEPSTIGSGEVTAWTALTSSTLIDNVGTHGADLVKDTNVFIWLELVIGASTPAANNVDCEMQISGDTAA